MALTYTESAGLMTNLQFQGRIQVACLKYASYILDEPSDTPAHSSRQRWAHSTMTSPAAAATAAQPSVVMDAAVQEAGLTESGDSTIDDAALQSAVEGVVNKMM